MRWLLLIAFLVGCGGTQAPQPKCGPVAADGMQQCGGPVLTPGVRVAVVYWARDTVYRGGPTPGTAGPGSTDTSLVGVFLRALGGSPWWQIESSYGVANVLTYDAYWANTTGVPVGSDTGTFVPAASVVAMLRTGIAGGQLPSASNVIYVVFTGAGVMTIGNFPTLCGEHLFSGALIYAVLPYAAGTSCEHVTGIAPFLSPNRDPAVDDMLTTLAHELAEAASDPFPPTGWVWYGHPGGENADRCEGFPQSYTTTSGAMATLRLGAHDYLIQPNWLHTGAGACVMGSP